MMIVGNIDELVSAIKCGEKSIHLRPGTYELSEPIILGPCASDIEIVGGDSVRFTRSVAVQSGDVVSCSIADAEPSPNSFKMLRPWAPMCFYDHKWAVPVRWPKDGWAVVEKKVETGRMLRADDNNPNYGSFIVDEKTASHMEKWTYDDIRLAGYWTHDWAFESVKVASYDAAKRLVTFASPTMYGIEGGPSWSASGGRRFYAYNVREELSEPGEWYYDRKSGIVEFVPPVDGVDELRVVSDLAPAIRIVGARNIVIRDVDIEYVAGNAIVITDSEDIKIAKCRIHNVGGDAVDISGGARCVVEDCEVDGIGRTAFLVSGGDRKKLVNAEHVIRNNVIHDFGRIRRTYSSAVDILGCGISVIGNTIFDAPHTAIFYGGNEMLIESNEIYHVLLETGDAGAVYSGRDPTSRGNILRYNYIHDCGVMNEDAASDPKTMAFYLDDCDCGDHFISNRIANVPRGMMIGGGHDIEVVGNSFTNCALGISVDGRGLSWDKEWDNPNDPSWQMTRKVNEMDVDKEPWRSRYPELVTYLHDNPRAPKYITIKDNEFVNCSRRVECYWMPDEVRAELDIES